MPVPEAAVDEDSCPVTRQHQIWTSRQTGSAKSIAESPRVQCPPHQQFQFRIRATYPRHLCGPLLGREGVDQVQAAFFARFFGAVASALTKGAISRATSAITGTTTELPNCL